MSYWREHNIEEKITHVLSDIPVYDPSHHFGRPFLTAYQIAIEFANRYPGSVCVSHKRKVFFRFNTFQIT